MSAECIELIKQNDDGSALAQTFKKRPLRHLRYIMIGQVRRRKKSFFANLDVLLQRNKLRGINEIINHFISVRRIQAIPENQLTSLWMRFFSVVAPFSFYSSGLSWDPSDPFHASSAVSQFSFLAQPSFPV